MLGTLQLEGRQLDVDHLARGLQQLDGHAIELVERLAAWGDEAFNLSTFGARCVARIHARSLLGHTDLTTFIFAQRREYGFALFCAVENSVRAMRGASEQPRSLVELIVMLDGGRVVEALYDGIDDE